MSVRTPRLVHISIARIYPDRIDSIRAESPYPTSPVRPQCFQHLGYYVDIHAIAPQDIQMFISIERYRRRRFGELCTHHVNVHKRVCRTK